MQQGNRLIDIDWNIEMELANEKGKSDRPIVSIQLQTISNSQLKFCNINMKG
jgi:hypothetical protein